MSAVLKPPVRLIRVAATILLLHYAVAAVFIGVLVRLVTVPVSLEFAVRYLAFPAVAMLGSVAAVILARRKTGFAAATIVLVAVTSVSFFMYDAVNARHDIQLLTDNGCERRSVLWWWWPM